VHELSTTDERPPNPAHSKIGFTEFVVLAAATMSTQAIAIDAILPAFPVIVQALNVSNPNHGQWLVTAYMTGMGCGQLSGA
jgi:MFS transporter, DHA1 family, multidrug resistance protein